MPGSIYCPPSKPCLPTSLACPHTFSRAGSTCPPHHLESPSPWASQGRLRFPLGGKVCGPQGPPYTQPIMLTDSHCQSAEIHKETNKNNNKIIKKSSPALNTRRPTCLYTCVYTANEHNNNLTPCACAVSLEGRNPHMPPSIPHACRCFSVNLVNIQCTQYLIRTRGR